MEARGRRLKANRFMVALAAWFLLTSLALVHSPSNHNESAQRTAVQSYIDHTPIVILSDDAFESQGWPGNGTKEQPYIIEGVSITAPVHCILIANTRSHFIIRECIFQDSEIGYSLSLGNVRLLNASHGIIFNCSLSGADIAIFGSNLSNFTFSYNALYECRAGVALDESEFCTITNNTISAVNAGISFLQTNMSMVVNNTVLHSDYGIELQRSNYNDILGNTVVARETGIQISNSSNYNTIYRNRVGWAKRNGYDTGISNSWDDNISQGNSWSDYVGAGVYAIYGPANSIDRFPSLFVGDYFGPVIEGLLRYYTADIFDGTPIESIYFEANVSDPSGVDTVLVLYGSIAEHEYYVMEHSPTPTNLDRYVYVIEGPLYSFSIRHSYWANDTLGYASETLTCEFSIGVMDWGPWTSDATTTTTVPVELPVLVLGAAFGIILVIIYAQRTVCNKGAYSSSI